MGITRRRSSINSLVLPLVVVCCLLFIGVTQAQDELQEEESTTNSIVETSSMDTTSTNDASATSASFGTETTQSTATSPTTVSTPSTGTSQSTATTPTTVSTPTTRTVSTTTTRRPTSTTVNIAPPNYANVQYDLNFTIGYDVVDLNDTVNYCNGAGKTNCSAEVVKSVDVAFLGTPGYQGCKVGVFYAASAANSGGQQLRLSLKSISKATNEVLAVDYTTYYKGDVFVDSKPNDIISFINANVTAKLTATTFFNYAADAAFINSTMDTQLKDQENWASDGCSKGTNICVQVCYPDCNDETYLLQCDPLCSSADNEQCTQPNATYAVCSCAPNYLPVSGNCVNQDLIIGLSAGLGGAFVLALIITIIVLVYNYKCQSSSASSRKGSLRSLVVVESQGMENIALTSSNVEMQPLDDSEGKTEAATFADESSNKPEPLPRTTTLDTPVDDPKNVVEDSPRYVINFEAQLKNVDVETSFAFKRPQVVDSDAVPMVNI